MRSVIIIILFNVLANVFANSIPLKNIESLTLFKGKYTDRNRTNPIPQLSCEGGSAGCAYAPDVVQCTNVGSNGNTVNWKCQATLPNGVEFGRIHISCEGFQYAGDPNVLQGSCGLKYYLEQAVTGQEQTSQPIIHKTSNVSFAFIFYLFVVMLLLIIAYTNYNDDRPRTYVSSPMVLQQQPQVVVQQPVIVEQPVYTSSYSTRYHRASTPVTLIHDPVVIVDRRPAPTHTVVHYNTSDDGLRNRSSATHTSTGFGTSSSD